MTSTTAHTALLLIETAQGDTVAVRFRSTDAAREWEDDHDGELTVRGCVNVVSAREALRLSVRS